MPLSAQYKKSRNLLIFINIVTASILLVIAVWLHLFVVESQTSGYHRALQKTQVMLQNQLDGFLHGLQGAQSVYVLKNFKPTRADFYEYARYRQFFNNFPGAEGFGFIRYITAPNFDSFSAKLKKESVDIKVLNRDYAKEYSDHFVIEVLEPATRNQKALGLDIGSEKNRRQAAWEAALAGRVTMTPPIQLVQSEVREPGILILLPLYANTQKKDIGSLVGWSFVPVRISSLLSEISKIVDSRVDIEIRTDDFDGKSQKIFNTLSTHKKYRDKEQIETSISIGGRVWWITAFPVYSGQDSFVRLSPWLGFVMVCLLMIGVSFWIYRLYLIRSKIEIQAQVAETWNEALLKAASYSIIATDTQGTIITFNKGAQKMLGYTEKELVRKATPEVIHDLDEVVRRAHCLTTELGREVKPGFETFVVKTAGGEHDINEWTYIRKDGSRIPVRLCVSAIRDEKSEIMGYMGIAEDLSEQKKILAQLEDQKAQLIHSAKMSSLGEMAGGIAHEINNPLATIRSSVDLLRTKIQFQVLDVASIEKSLIKMDKTTDRISKIIKGLRAFSRNAEGDDFVVANVKEIIDDTLEFCSSRFKANQIDVRVNVDDQWSVRCRPTQISQVFMNLLNNAADAVENLPEKWISVDVCKRDQSLAIVVTDSGGGIPVEVAKKMMDPFYTTKDIGRGTGLGLSISLGILKAHGGELQYSLVDSHTQFRMEIPLSH